MNEVASGEWRRAVRARRVERKQHRQIELGAYHINLERQRINTEDTEGGSTEVTEKNWKKTCKTGGIFEEARGGSERIQRKDHLDFFSSSM